MSASLQEEKKFISFKGIIIILIAFLIVPLFMGLILYYSNEDFKDTAHHILSGLPGVAGEYFQSMPSKEEREELKRQIANAYVLMNEERIADKLLLIRNEDQQLYHDLLTLMNRQNNRKMQGVQEIIRRHDMRDDLLVGLYNEIQNEASEEIYTKTDQLRAMATVEAIQYIDRNHRSGHLSIEELSNIFTVMPIGDAVKILAYLNQNIKEQVMYQLPINLRREVEERIEGIHQHQHYLIELATYYENQSVGDALDDIGHENLFNMEDLGAIYRYMSLDKGAQLLSSIEDRQFKLDLYESINELEKLMGHTPITAELLTKGTQAYREYDEKVNELTDIYQRMNRAELADLIARMWRSNQLFNEVELTADERILFDERKLVADVLSRLRPNVVAELMELMEDQLVTEISQALIS